MNKLFSLIILIGLFSLSPTLALTNGQLNWEDNLNEPIIITDGDVVRFKANIGSFHPPTHVVIKLLDSSGTTKHYFVAETMPANEGTKLVYSAWFYLTPEIYETLGEFHVQLLAKDSIGGEANSRLDFTVVREAEELTVDVSANPTTVYENEDVTFGCSANGGHPEYVYTWTYGDGNFELTQNGNHVYSEAGIYSARCNVVDQNGNMVYDEVTITVKEPIIPNDKPEALFSMMPNPSLIGEQVHFDGTLSNDPDGDSLTYQWDLGNDGDIDGMGAHFYKTFNYPANYPMRLIVSDGEDSDEIVKYAIVQEYFEDFEMGMDVTPGYGDAPLKIKGACRYNAFGEGLDGSYEIIWSMGDGTTLYGESITHTYQTVGIYTATCKVKQVETGIIKQASEEVRVLEVVPSVLEITRLNCFDQIIAGHEQACEVFVEEDHEVSPNTLVNLYKTSGEHLGSCQTNSISGGCNIQFMENTAGTFTVYATATKTGFTSDDDTYPRFTYNVLEETFDIKNLKVYEDPDYSIEQDIFYRGEDLYVSFEVFDVFGNSVSPLDIKVTKATLISTPGGRVELVEDFSRGNKFFYKLSKIPLTHNFFGDSQVFTFAFDFENGGGQETADLTILNNPPTRINIPDQVLAVGTSKTLSLDNYFDDLEQDILEYEVSYNNNAISTKIINREDLIINGLSSGNSIITVTAEDYDGDTVEESFNVKVENLIYEGYDVEADINPRNGIAPHDVVGTCDVVSHDDGEDASYVYLWDMDDGTTYMIANVEHTYTEIGDYHPTCTVTQEETGIKEIDYMVVYVEEEEEPDYEDFKLFNAVVPLSGEAPLLTYTWCYPVTIPFTGEDATYETKVDFGDGSMSNNSGFQTHTYEDVGVYTYTCEVTQVETGITKSGAKTITVTEDADENMPPVAVIEGPSKVFEGDTVVFDASDSYDPENEPLLFEWFIDGKVMGGSTSNSLSASFKNKGTYTIAVEVTDVKGSKDTASLTLVVSLKTTYATETEKDPDFDLTFQKIGIMGHDVNRVKAGKTLYVTIGIDSDETKGRPSLIVPELGLKATGQLNSLDGRESMTAKLWIPENTPKGYYMLRVGFKSEDVRKGEIRWFKVE